MAFGYQTFNHLNRQLLVRFSRHGLTNGPSDEQTVLDHLNTEIFAIQIHAVRISTHAW